MWLCMSEQGSQGCQNEGEASMGTQNIFESCLSQAMAQKQGREEPEQKLQKMWLGNIGMG